jgi:cell cycle sensor histidine kinase DivJ
MSKIEAGKFELSEEIFDLEETAGQALRFVKLQADRKGVVLGMNISEDAKRIFADRRAVKQVLVNLLTNGVKFTPRGGDIRVAGQVTGGGIEIAVVDSGIGIAPVDLERLGRPFEQVDGAHVRAQEGTGLGLALVKALAQLHGGEAVIESTLGVGTTVRLRLPHAAVSRKGECVETVEVLKGAA